MSLIEAAKQAWAEQQITNERAEREHQELIKSRAIDLMQRITDEAFRSSAPDRCLIPVYRSHNDLEDGDIEVFFVLDDLLFRASSRDDIRRLYLLVDLLEIEIFNLAHLGRVLEERGVR